MGGSTVFMYFTIQSNILIALVCSIGFYFLLINKKNNIWLLIKFISTVSITLTGLVFSFVLAPTMGASAWGIANVLTHVIVPIMAIVDFFVVGINSNYKKTDVFYVVIPPLLYAVYAGLGYALNWKFTSTTNYPYFFLNWGSEAKAFGFSSKLPFMGVVWWIVLLLALLIGIGFLYLKIISVLKKKFGELDQALISKDKRKGEYYQKGNMNKNMKYAIRYYTKTGNTKKLADVIAQELGVEAKSVTEPLEENVDVLFLCSSVYWAGVNKSVKDFIKGNATKIGNLVNVSTAAIIESTYGQVKKLAKNENIDVCEKEFHCRGKFAALHSSHPNDADIENLKKFIKEVTE